MPWAITRAHEGLAGGVSDYCYEPILLSWQGSFGGGPVVIDGIKLPPSEVFSELGPISSGIIRESTKLALDAMAKFNMELLSQCFGYLER